MLSAVESPRCSSTHDTASMHASQSVILTPPSPPRPSPHATDLFDMFLSRRSVSESPYYHAPLLESAHLYGTKTTLSPTKTVSSLLFISCQTEGSTQVPRCQTWIFVINTCVRFFRSFVCTSLLFSAASSSEVPVPVLLLLKQHQQYSCAASCNRGIQATVREGLARQKLLFSCLSALGIIRHTKLLGTTMSTAP